MDVQRDSAGGRTRGHLPWRLRVGTGRWPDQPREKQLRPAANAAADCGCWGHAGRARDPDAVGSHGADWSGDTDDFDSLTFRRADRVTPAEYRTMLAAVGWRPVAEADAD